MPVQPMAKLAEDILAELRAIYTRKGRVASPMSASELDVLTVPMNMDGKQYGPLPWDVRLLLGFDRNLTLGWDTDPLFRFFTRDREHLFLGPEALLDMLDELDIVPADERVPGAENQAQEQFLEMMAGLPPLLSLSQLGGDEIPFLWPSEDPADGSSVVHFDYDDMPEFYLRNTCFLDYVLQYVTEENGNAAMARHKTGYAREIGTDYSILFTPEADLARFHARKNNIKRLNQALEGVFEIIWPDY